MSARDEERRLTVKALRLIRSIALSWDLTEREERRLLGSYTDPDTWEAELLEGAPWALPRMSDIARFEDILVVGLQGRKIFGCDRATGLWLRRRHAEGPLKIVPPLTWMVYGGCDGVRLVREDLEARPDLLSQEVGPQSMAGERPAAGRRVWVPMDIPKNKCVHNKAHSPVRTP